MPDAITARLDELRALRQRVAELEAVAANCRCKRLKPCGTAASYIRGCRCRACYDAHRARTKTYRAAYKYESPAPATDRTRWKPTPENIERAKAAILDPDMDGWELWRIAEIAHIATGIGWSMTRKLVKGLVDEGRLVKGPGKRAAYNLGRKT